MKKLILFLIISFAFSDLFSQSIVTAPSGLVLRSEPKIGDNRVGKLAFAAQVKIVEKTDHTLSIKDNGKTINGHWVKVEFGYDLEYSETTNTGYVFDGFLTEKKGFVDKQNQKLQSFSKLKDHTIADDMPHFYLKGDFFGDKVADDVFLVKAPDNSVKICFIDYGGKTQIRLLGNGEDDLGSNSYDWAEVFHKVNPGTTLWANYEDDYVDFDDVPESKKVHLNYNAIYAHLAEACGGGFIFWKDGKFNWLQQE